MYEADVQLVLRCTQCNKPFDKESTLKRHGYYCRSRKTGPVIRHRSCAACVKAKAGCNNEHPRCSRCLSKGIICHYPANVAKSTGAQRRRNGIDNQLLGQEKISLAFNKDHPSFERHHDVDNDGVESLDVSPEISDFNFADIGTEYFDLDFNFVDFTNPPIDDKVADYQSSISSSPSSHSDSVFGQINQQLQATYSATPAIQRMPTSTVRSFTQRTKTKIGAPRTVTLILHTLKSYPLMMLHDNAFPPFIHPISLSPDLEHKHLEPLFNCVNLMRMLGGGISGSQKLFWKNVRMECEHMCANHTSLSRWQLLAAMQALSIYTLVRLNEGETDHNNFDSLLVQTVIMVATQFNDIRIDLTPESQSVLYQSSPKARWNDWILEESVQRLCLIYQVVNMLVYFEPAAMCDLHHKDLLLAPLPAKKQLWEASNESVWQSERERESGGSQKAFGLSQNGDLVRIDKGRRYCDDEQGPLRVSSLDQPVTRNTANWEEWCSGMDGLGGLVMLAASLVK